MKKIVKMITFLFALVIISTLSIYAATIFNSNAVSYDNDSSGMKSTNVQDAIDELYLASSSDCALGYSKGTTSEGSYICNKESEVATGTINYDSSYVAYDNSNGMTADTVQGALDELAGILSTRYCIDNYSKQNETSSGYECKINTLPSTLTITNAQVSLTYGGSSSNNSYSYNGDGVVSCQSSDTTKVTCTVDTTNSKITVTPIGATTSNVTITISASETINYYAPNNVTFTVSVAKASLTCPSTATSTVTFNGSKQTYNGNNCPSGSSRTAASGTNVGTYYATCTADSNHSFSSTCNPGKLTIEAAYATCPTTTAYTGTYDAKAHGISVSGGANGTIQYSTNNSTWSTTNPTRTNAGSQTTYVRIYATGNYKTNTCTSRAITINKANGYVNLSASSGSVACKGTTSFTVKSHHGGTLSCSSSNTSIATCSGTSTITVTGKGQGSATITVTSAATTNYKAASATYRVTTGSCASWHLDDDEGDTDTCEECCALICQRWYSSSVWSCVSSGRTAPTSAKLITGPYCWCKY